MSAVLSPIAPAPAATTTPPPVKSIPAPPAGPQPFRWTIELYRELGRLEFFQTVKTMLIDGEIYVMAPPKPPHDIALELTAIFLRATFPVGYFVRNQMGFDIGTKTDPSPDLVVVVGDVREHLAKTPSTALLIVEIADSSLFTDTTSKAELYATAGVPEYWVLDFEHRRLLVYRDPEPLPAGLGATAYRTHLAFEPEQVVAPLAAPTAAVKVADLLP